MRDLSGAGKRIANHGIGASLRLQWHDIHVIRCKSDKFMEVAQLNPLMHKVPERQIALTSKLKTMGWASMEPNPIVLRYHFGNFVH